MDRVNEKAHDQPAELRFTTNHLKSWKKVCRHMNNVSSRS